MTPNPTSAPAPQEQGYPRPARPVAAFYTKFRNDHAVKDGEALTFHQWLDFADAWAEAGTLRLAEEAEREYEYWKPTADALGAKSYWQNVAAWLREKAQ